MAVLHTTPLWTHAASLPTSRSSSPLPFFPGPTMHDAPSTALVPGCKLKPGSTPAVRPGLTTRSTSTSSLPQLTSILIPSTRSAKESSSTAINIPSPPLTPHTAHCDLEDNDDWDVNKATAKDSAVFSSRFETQRQLQCDLDVASLMRQSTSAPSAMSPLQLRAASAVTTGFTFSGNLMSPTQAKEERESYEMFVSTMEDDYWKSVSTIRTTYFFDGIGRGGGFLAIPHIASHGNAKTNVICRLLEAWLTKKLVEPTISDSIPVLEDNIESSVQSIERHLRQDPKVWSGISKSFIHIRCGHVFMLDTCCDDETIVHLGADEFYQNYPLFVDVEIKMQCDSTHLPKDHSAEVVIAFQNVVNRNRTKEEEKPYVHRAVISDTKQRRQSLDDVASA